MDIGINSNLWPEETHQEEMPRILAEMAQAGFAGVEIGAQRVMEAYDLVFFYLHTPNLNARPPSRRDTRNPTTIGRPDGLEYAGRQ